MKSLLTTAVFSAALLSAALVHGIRAEPQSDSDFALTSVDVFDGETMHQRVTLLVRDGKVAALGADVSVPEDMKVIDAAGHTLLPGLIDAHVHTFGQARSDALRFGVTTMLDMFTSPQMLPGAREQREQFSATDQADLYSAGMLATAEGGHGTQFGVPVEPVNGPDDAAGWVQERIAEGSDYIKIIVEDGSTHGGRNIPTLDAATVRALVEAAHDNGLMALAHVSTLADAIMTVEAGVNGLVHVFHDQPASDEFLDLAVERDLFVVPTAIVFGAMIGAVDSSDLIEHPELGGLLSAEQRQTLGQARQGSDSAAATWQTVKDNISALHETGIPLLAGSDAPNPGTAHGISLHRELEVLVAAGLDEIEALQAATATPARHFDLAGRGCLEPGCRADMLLVKGDPLEDITATRRIDRVWKNGLPVAIEPARSAGAGLQRDTDSLLAPDEQAHWQAASDDFMGGSSTARIRFEEQEVLIVEGELSTAPFPPYSGAMWMPGESPMQPVDIGDRTRLEVEVQGTQGPWQVMVFSGSGGAGRPLMLDLEATDTGARLDTDLATHSGIDTDKLQAIGVFAVGDPREVSFRVHRVSLQ